MGRYSDSDDEYRKSKKKKKRSSRSRSRSSDSSYSSYSSSKKHKKSKKKHRKRSRSRSGSRDRYYSPYRRRSRSPRRRSRSRSRDRHRSRSPKYRRSRSRSRSWSRSRRRSRSRSRSPRGRRSRSRSRDRGSKNESDKDPSKTIPGWDLMGPAEQAEARLQLALKAAANVDENLREQGLLGGRKLGGSASNSPLLTFDERLNRNKVISDIESSGFSQTTFKSSKSQRSTLGSDINDAHDAAIFGGEIPMGAGGEMPILSFSNQPLKDKDTESLMHPNLYVSSEEKMDRWIAKLKAFRRQKLEGSLLK